jgi:hypothetical protein
MDECSVGSLSERTGCILSYDRTWKDVAINYALLTLNAAMCYIILKYQVNPRIIKFRLAMASFVAVIVFQIVLCLLVKCAGISIVWCACAGWIMAERRHVIDTVNLAKENITTGDSLMSTVASPIDWVMTMERVVILIDVGAIIYYAIVQEPITTVAHLLAMILGSTLSFVCIKLGEHLMQSSRSSYCAIA